MKVRGLANDFPPAPRAVWFRVSVLFIHARSDVLLEPDATGHDRAAYPPITAGELLLKRLKAIGLA